MTKRKFPFALLLLAVSGGSVQAAVSQCAFDSGTGDLLMSWGGVGALNTRSGISQPTQIGLTQGYVFGNTTSRCTEGEGDENRTLWFKTDASAVGAGTVKSSLGEDTPLFATSVPGIAYSLAMVSSSGITVYMNNTSSADWQNAGAFEAGRLNGTSWRYVARVYQLPAYRAGSATAVNAQMANLGSFLLGDKTRDPSVNMKTTTGSLGLLLNTPTCDTALLAPASNVQGSNLDLGTYYQSELKAGSTPRAVPFALNFTGCGAVQTISARLSSNFLASDPSLLGPSNAGGATGLGVKIEGENGSQQLIPNDLTSLYSQTDEAMTDTRQLKFNAYLLNDGGTVGTGTFETSATFNLTYE